VAVPVWIWVVFLFAVGCCVGSFLNVVIYRMPRDLSLVTPRSACPACHKPICFYDNIPLVSWFVLRGKCRYCKSPISPRYFVIELLTGLLFVGVFILYFIVELRHIEIGSQSGMGVFLKGGWLVYLVHIILLAAFLAASAIDLELWLIPLAICWFVSGVGLFTSTISAFVIEPGVIKHYDIFPTASADSAALAVGAGLGLLLSLLLLHTGLIKQSYLSNEPQEPEPKPDSQDISEGETSSVSELEFNHRVEMLRELVFLAPIMIFSVAAWCLLRKNGLVVDWWLGFSQIPAIRGFLGSLWGFFVGGAVVWAARILGTLAFSKEAMGLGDVYMMAAAGTIIGPVFVFIAFFIAPFFGLAWAAYQMLSKKTRQIPYGPFLSLAVFVVMINHDQVLNYLQFILFR
jgi:leader peptidase (prepilin peptidase)/N-methyltransferase